MVVRESAPDEKAWELKDVLSFNDIKIDIKPPRVN